MTSLWKKLQFEWAARDITLPPKPVREEMEKSGWKFEIKCDLNVSAIGAFAAVARVPKTPEGVFVAPGTEDQKRYRAARREAAKKVFDLT